MSKYFAVLFFVFFALAAQADEALVTKEGVYLKDYTIEELQKEFSDLAYDEFLNPADNEYPRVFVQNIPSDIDTIENKTQRNQIFMQILLPHILKINQELLEKRETLLAIKDEFKDTLDIDPIYCDYVEEMAPEYDVVTPFKDSRRCMKLLDELILRVDAVPPSIVIASAAINTKWGTSRIALEGNNLFKALNWFSEEGLKPEGEDENEPYRYTIFPTIEDSIRQYMHRLNSDVNFIMFRVMRETAHKRHKYLYGKHLMWGLSEDNNLKNYIGLLDYTITFYRMTFFDEAKLEKEYDFID